MTTVHGETSSRPVCNADAVFGMFATMSMATLQKKEVCPDSGSCRDAGGFQHVENDLHGKPQPSAGRC